MTETTLNTWAGIAPLKDRGDDLYETPPEATLALLQAEQLPHRLWEPACGPGAIVNVLRKAGHSVVATDLVDYGLPITPPSYYRRDFLMEQRAPEGCEGIVTNPPFKLASEFVAHSLDLCPLVVMLLRLTFIESTRRSAILDNGHLARVLVFSNRLPMMHRAGRGTQTAKSTSNAIAYAWFIWDRQHKGPTEIRRISWTPVTPAAHENRARSEQ